MMLCSHYFSKQWEPREDKRRAPAPLQKKAQENSQNNCQEWSEMVGRTKALRTKILAWESASEVRSIYSKEIKIKLRHHTEGLEIFCMFRSCLAISTLFSKQMSAMMDEHRQDPAVCKPSSNLVDLCHTMLVYTLSYHGEMKPVIGPL